MNNNSEEKRTVIEIEPLNEPKGRVYYTRKKQTLCTVPGAYEDILMDHLDEYGYGACISEKKKSDDDYCYPCEVGSAPVNYSLIGVVEIRTEAFKVLFIKRDHFRGIRDKLYFEKPTVVEIWRKPEPGMGYVYNAEPVKNPFLSENVNQIVKRVEKAVKAKTLSLSSEFPPIPNDIVLKNSEYVRVLRTKRIIK